MRKYGWHGIVVEPVPYLFKRLKETYAGQVGIAFENVAIGAEDGYKTFYRIKENAEPQNPYYYEYLGSFRKEVVLKHRYLIPHFDKYFMSEEIRCVSFTTLIDTHGVQKIDVLHIDTEGYDYEIIKTIPFERIRPHMILYEHSHLSATDKRACQVLLKEKGYRLRRMYKDTLAYTEAG